jgi:tetratricopeptide (TPR) repeat protein
MRAREGLANTLWELGRPEEALEHFQEMLSLNPGDNQGIRYSMLNLLMDMGRDADAEKLIRQYEGDGFATWLYSRALLLYRKSGPTNQANAALEAALTQNTYVPAYLTARKRIPLNLPEYIGYGDENEAVSYASVNLSHWRRSPGAIEWLQSHLIDVGSKKTGVAPKKSMTKRSGRKKSM